MEQPIRAPFDQASMPESDIKGRFYRYFQGEVIELQEQMSRLENYSLIGGERPSKLSQKSSKRLELRLHPSPGFNSKPPGMGRESL